MRWIKIIIYSTFILVLFSCKKENETENTNSTTSYFSNGLLVLNEGLFQQNNSHLSWVNFTEESINNTIFEQKNNKNLGDTGNDLIRYGNKVYVVVNNSSTIEVLDAMTGYSITQIAMSNNGIAKQPRFAQGCNGFVFVSCFDGFVDVIDTMSLSITHRIAVGANPDGIHYANNKIYTTNSGGLSFPNVDSTLSVIDPVSMVEINRIVVGKNPVRVTSDANGDLYVLSFQDLDSYTSQLVKINHVTEEIDTVFNWNILNMSSIGNKLLLFVQEGTSHSIKLFDPISESIVNANFIDASLFTTYYGAQYDPIRNQIYCFDAMSYVNSGYVRVFNSNGTYLKSYKVGLNPSKLLIYE